MPKDTGQSCSSASIDLLVTSSTLNFTCSVKCLDTRICIVPNFNFEQRGSGIGCVDKAAELAFRVQWRFDVAFKMARHSRAGEYGCSTGTGAILSQYKLPRKCEPKCYHTYQSKGWS
jgi:hypothetical protein